MEIDLRDRIHSAWQGRISGCQLGKAVELMSMRYGRAALTDYLREADSLPVRDYIPLIPGSPIEKFHPECCRGQFDRAEPDDDINYSVLSLLMLEEKGADLATADVARAWLRYLPGGIVFTAERSALVTLLQKSSYGFPTGAEPGFDLAECSDNEFNHWIGAQIRADLYGWVLPGHPDQAADLARRDAELSHRGEGVYGAMAVAAIGAALPEAHDAVGAVSAALDLLPATSDCADAMRLALEVAASGAGPGEIHRRYDHLSPVHTVNNLALVVWGLVAAGDDFGAAVGDTVAAGWDTDCNAATVGGLWGLSGRAVPLPWTEPWNGRVEVSLAGMGELALDELVERTVAVAESM
ncbi:MAG: ADP-ribosylglycohydrolase family protein [Actinomycetia bacterium]|nr:ADP-ribosylglycohydrolase family protein [Actinomycetes bacterium]